MRDLKKFRQLAADWKITSLGDFGAFAGYGAKIGHYRFYSPSIGIKMHTALILVGVGVGADIAPSFLSGLNSMFDNLTKAKDAAFSESNYAAVDCHRAFSLMDIDGAKASTVETALSIPFGYKTAFFHTSGSPLGPASGALIFSVPASVDPTYGLKAEAAATSGVFIGLDNYHYEAMAQDRQKREMSRRPSDPLVRPAGGF